MGIKIFRLAEIFYLVNFVKLQKSVFDGKTYLFWNPETYCRWCLTDCTETILKLFRKTHLTVLGGTLGGTCENHFCRMSTQELTQNLIA